jgi:hypothetical protein
MVKGKVMSSTSNVWRVCRALFLGGGMLVLAGIVWLACMVKVHDQDVTVYSVMPDNKVQVIGLRHRTYLLDYGGSSDLVLFSTTFGRGVLTHAHKNDLYGEANWPPQVEADRGAVVKPWGLSELSNGGRK